MSIVLSYAVAEKPLEQFKSDLNAFLRARAQEMNEGGVMFLILPCRISFDPREQGSLLSFCGQLLVAAFRDKWDMSRFLFVVSLAFL